MGQTPKQAVQSFKARGRGGDEGEGPMTKNDARMGEIWREVGGLSSEPRINPKFVGAEEVGGGAKRRVRWNWYANEPCNHTWLLPVFLTLYAKCTWRYLVFDG